MIHYTMSSSLSLSEKLKRQLEKYIIHTLIYTETVKEFCDGEPEWTLNRVIELNKITNIKTNAEKKSIWRIQKTEQELEKELGEVLKNTLEGLEKLQHFLDAVEKLAVTSLFVFMGESFMSEGVRSIHSVISAAKMVSPLLVHFKRDAGAFFLPSLSNVEVLDWQLNKYITKTTEICKKMEKSFMSVLCDGNIQELINGKSSLKLNLNMNKESVVDLYDHLLQLTKIRMDKSFRMTFLFGSKAQDFIDLFSDNHSRMSQFLSDLEEAAVELDKMKLGSNISTVAGSSVGVVGGVLSIVGLALAPVTAGVSLALTLAGVGLGVTSGVNSLVTGITEMAVNRHHGGKANNTFIRFMEDVQKILKCMEDVACREGAVEGINGDNILHGAGKVCIHAGAVGKCIDGIVDAASAVKALRSEEVIAKAVNLGLQEAKAGQSIPKLAADLPDIGQLAKGTPIALSGSARAGFIGLNALFIGLDVFLICKDSVSLYKGSKNETAQLIRSRSVLWRSEVEAWEKIYNHLSEGISGFNKNWEILEQPLEF